MELQLGLALPGNPINMLELDPSSGGKTSVSHSNYPKKRSFDDAFREDIPQTLQLLVWNDSPNKDDDDDDDDDDSKDTQATSSITINNDDGNGGSLVGWPPIRYRKKKVLVDSHGIEVEGINSIAQETNGGGNLQSNSMYVKVKVEGVGIARKVDLSLHHSYQTLTDTLLGMFDICNCSL